MVFYNEIDPHAAAWLRELGRQELIPDGEVLESDIRSVQLDDVRHARQAHFFAGIGGWPLALDLAGWPRDRPVWTGSCPCQPYSSAGKGKGNADDRNLWPAFFGLIRECHPDVVFGEQVASAIGHGWLDGVSADLEGEGYAVGAVVLGAHSVGAPHQRQRLYWVAHLPEHGRRQGNPDFRRSNQGVRTEGDGGRPDDDRQSCRMAYGDSQRFSRRAEPDGDSQRPDEQASRRPDVVRCGGPGGLGDSIGPRLQRHEASGPPERGDAPGPGPSFWADHDLLPCRDGKSRRVEPGTFPLAHGLPARVGRLRGYGNAIVPQTAALFIQAFIDTLKGAA